MYFLRVLNLVKFPVYECLTRKNKPGRLREQLMYHHWKANVDIIQEEVESLPRCNHCGIHMPEARMIKQILTEICNKATKMRIRHMDVDMEESCGQMEFILYGREGGRWCREMEILSIWGGPLTK